jgi:hypothetical protein
MCHLRAWFVNGFEVKPETSKRLFHSTFHRGYTMKFHRLICLLTLPVFLTCLPSAKADWYSVISAANPLNWFSFEEAPGSTVADDQGSANLDGTYAGGVGLGAAGLVGSAATFDGTTGYVLVGGANLGTDWTVETILRADTLTGGASQGIIGADFTAADRVALKAEQWNETGQIGYTVFGVVDVTYTDAAAATPADFAHVTFVGTASGTELFIDGVSVGSDPTTAILNRHVLAAGAIRADGSLIDPLNGSIDELVIYDRALSAAEISAHFAAVPEPSTIGLMLLGVLGFLGFRAYKR